MDMKPVSFLKRLGALLYDAFLVFSFVGFLGFISMALLMQALDIKNLAPDSLITQYFFVYLLGLSFFFFAWFWTHGGQTLGMRAWKIKLVTLEGKTLNWLQSFVRFIYITIFLISPILIFYGLNIKIEYYSIWLFVPFVFNYIWIIMNKNKMSLHDYLSKTHLVRNN